MGYTEQFRELKKSIDKSNRLNYFKAELLKILDKKERSEDTLSKSIQTYFDDLNKTLYGISIEKGKVGTVGEIRTWKDGKKYKKMPNGKWVRVYQQQNRSAEISIARLKGKVRNAQSVDELMNIVMANIHRFEDENGQILPIVEELKKEVASGKARINAGKPSTQQQIEKFKTENNVNNPLSKFEKDYKYIMQIDNVDERYKQMCKLRDHIEEEKNKMLEKFRKDNFELIHSDNRLYFEKRHELVKPYHNLWSKAYDQISKDYSETTEYKERQKQLEEHKAKVEAEKKAKLDKANKKIAEQQEKINAVAEKYKDATIESLESEIPELSKNYETKNKERKKLEGELKHKKYIVSTEKNPQSKWSMYSKEDIEEAKKYVAENNKKVKDLKAEVESIKTEMDAKMDIYMDLMEKREYIPDERIEKCTTVQEVNDLFNSHKDWFSFPSLLGKTEFKKIDLQSAKEIYKCYDKMFNRFPFMKGISGAPAESQYSYNIYAKGGPTGITLNTQRFKNWDKTAESYSHDVEISFHPANTDIRCILYHEFAHTIDLGWIVQLNSGIGLRGIKTIADNIKTEVLNKFKGHDSISNELSQYATKNANEFFAEGLGEAFNSESPRRFAKECLRQVYKYSVIYKGYFDEKRNRSK